jgi:hypothetical protein
MIFVSLGDPLLMEDEYLQAGEVWSFDVEGRDLITIISAPQIVLGGTRIFALMDNKIVNLGALRSSWVSCGYVRIS